MTLTAYLQQNTLTTYVEAVAAIFIAAAFFAFLQKFLLARAAKAAERSKTDVDDAVVAMLRNVRPPFYWFLSLYIGLRLLALPPIVNTVINGLLLAWVLIYAVKVTMVDVTMVIMRGATSESERTARHILVVVAKATVWIIAILLLLANLGINITSLVAGLGIGGVAIAFALQNILSDLFSSFAIFFDKPFEVGDFIIVGSDMGVVEKVGIKSTRMTALSGEGLVIANKDLTSARIHNYKQMKERRVVMDFGITYETPKEVIAALPDKIRGVVEQLEDIRIDRVHFAGFGDSSLNFELVYYVTSGDYTQYMDRQQSINLALVELFESEGVSFAYPTRMVYTAPAASAAGTESVSR